MRRLRYSTVIAALLPAVLSTTASADVFLPEGDLGSALHVSDDLKDVRRIEGLPAVHGLAYAPGRDVLVAGSMDVVDSAQSAAPEGMSESEHGAHHGAGATETASAASMVTLVEAATGKILRRVEVPGVVHHVAVDDDGRRAVVTHPGLSGVSVIDLETYEVSDLVPTGPGPEYAAYVPKLDAFVVSNAGNATLSVLDAAEAFVTRNIKLGAGPKHLAVEPGTGRVLASLADVGRIALVDLEAGEVVREDEIDGELHGIAFHGPHAFVSARERDRIVRLDLVSGAVDEADIGPQPYHMEMFEDRLLVSSAAEPVVWAVDPDTLKTTRTLRTEGVVHQIVTAGR